MRNLLVLCVALFSIECVGQKLQPTDSLVLLQTSVIDTDSNAVIGETMTLTNLTTNISYVGVSDGKGKFDLLIPDNAKYEVIVKSFGPEKKSHFDLPNFHSPMTVPYSMTTQKQSMFQLGVQYAVNSAEITKDTYVYIDQLFEYMKGKEGVKIEIGGHTDADGSNEANLALSKARAESVRSYLIKKGVDATKVVAKGYGESMPVATNDTPEGKRLNRRTEVKILSK
jgi:OOP family OmpA-OmpF porin